MVKKYIRIGIAMTKSTQALEKSGKAIEDAKNSFSDKSIIPITVTQDKKEGA